MTSIKVTNIPVQPLFLGFPGENDSRPVYVDVSPWLEEFPDATVSIVYTRSDGLTYAVVVNQIGPVVTWKPIEADLVEGKCRLQIQIKQGDAVKKDRIIACVVGESLDDPSDPPQEPRPTYVDEVLDAADRAENAVEHYPQIRNGYWWVWDVASGEWVNTGVKATGEGGTAADAVLYTPQTLTPAQQAQARENIGAMKKPDEYEFADEIPQDADTTKKYVLPDGYIYEYGTHTYHRVYNAAEGGLLNKAPALNQGINYTDDQPGAFYSAPIPWDSSWTQWEKTPTIIRISGLDQLVPVKWNNAIQPWYFKGDGSYKNMISQQSIHSFVGGTPAAGDSISLPCEFNMADNNFYPLEGTGYVRIFLGISDGAITADDVANLVINVPFYDEDVTATEWYNTGERYISDPQVAQNTEDIAALDTRVTDVESNIDDLREAIDDGGSVPQTNQVLYAVGDSITRGAVAGGEDYAWVKHVIDINGYDAESSLNLGQNGLGFDTAATGSGDTIKAIVDRTDFSAADIVTVALGCNDWSNSNALLENVWANMEYCFNKIRTDNPYCKLFYILPFNMSFLGTYNSYYCFGAKGDSNPLCPYAYTLQQFNGMIKSKLSESTFQAFRINVIDLTEGAAINRHNILTALADQVHPTAETQTALGREIAPLLRIVDVDAVPSKVSQLTNDSGYQTAAQVQTAIAGKADKTQRIAMTSADTTPTLDPNKLYVFPEMASLAPTFAAPSDNTIVNEYHFIFTSGATATTLTVPASVKQPDGFTVEANHVYEVSILENCMTAQGWAVSA
jgi:lysophospholipase L1-like esterase